MGLEIERKFLIEELPLEKLCAEKSQNLIQGYLFLEENQEIRLRKKGEQYFLTQKTGNGLVREENEEEISIQVFSMLWPYTEGKRVEKQRFHFEYMTHECEIDVYSGDLADLMVMEVEFENEEAAANFSPPPFCMRDITSDKRFKNACLAKLGKPVSL
ncbi:CYTH domain-containing protein [Teredinibacter haidensis]|uniref:CYTH domain-containing protein n=1 Tax=Teredinibacter haidensis TaxID=2731755 RepID=UPI0009491910|nr:CYTH domain-containing protein [Teredinibacter haidensis]